MLLAEIHGKGIADIENSEDYLTSAVFGHLRYLQPSIFWSELFECATSIPDESNKEISLSKYLAKSNVDIGDYDSLDAYFWKYFPDLGEPDLILVFTGNRLPPIVVLVEIKLWSPKSGTDEEDQIVRYVSILNGLKRFDGCDLSDAIRALVYLTPRDSLVELKQSAFHLSNSTGDKDRLFRLRWQDINWIAKRCQAKATGISKRILVDIGDFLSRRALERFDGWRRSPLQKIENVRTLLDDHRETRKAAIGPDGRQARKKKFGGFEKQPNLDHISVRPAGWTK